MSFIRSVRRTAGMTLAGIVAVAITGWLLTHGSAKTDTAARGTAHVQLDRIAAAPIRSGPRLRAGPGRTRRTAGQDRRRRGRQRLVRLAGEQAPAIRSGLADGTVKRAPTTATELAAPLTLTVTLRRSDQPGFERFLSAVTDPKSPDFRHFLSQRVLTARFGPSRSAYRSVKRWLTASGFRLLRGSANRLQEGSPFHFKGFQVGAHRLFVPAEDSADAQGCFAAARLRPACAKRYRYPAQ